MNCIFNTKSTSFINWCPNTSICDPYETCRDCALNDALCHILHKKRLSKFVCYICASHS